MVNAVSGFAPFAAGSIASILIPSWAKHDYSVLFANSNLHSNSALAHHSTDVHSYSTLDLVSAMFPTPTCYSSMVTTAGSLRRRGQSLGSLLVTLRVTFYTILLVSSVKEKSFSEVTFFGVSVLPLSGNDSPSETSCTVATGTC